MRGVDERAGRLASVRIPPRGGGYTLTSPGPDATLADVLPVAAPDREGLAMNDLEDKIAVVTGGASGIGRALCAAFAAEGAHVVAADLDAAGLAETVAAVTRAGRRGLAVTTDVSRLADVQALADRAFTEMGGVHVLCHNARVPLGGGPEAAPPPRPARASRG